MMKRMITLLVLLSIVGGSVLAEVMNDVVTCPHHNAKNVTCVECHWVGTYSYQHTSSCLWCSGGTKTCYQCKGSGVSGWSKCFICNGAKKIKCSSCNGTGKGKTLTLEREFCPECYKSNIVCNICYGTDGMTVSVHDENTAVFSYRDVMRTPDEHVTQSYTITGTVESLEELCDGVFDIRLAHNSSGITYSVQLRYFAKAGATKILVGDKISAYGVFVSYDQKDVPMFFVVEACLDN